jgi:hypothetical protein
MKKLTSGNYYQDTEYLSYSMIKDFQKCEFLYSQRRKGLVPEIPRDYFIYGRAFDSYFTGSFNQEFIVAKLDPAKQIEQIKAVQQKSQEMIDKYKSDKSPKAQKVVQNHEKKITDYAREIKRLESQIGKQSITETIMAHIEASAAEMKRQSLIGKFERKPENDQVIITTKLKRNGEGSIWAKGRLDYLHLPNKVIMDYKTAADLTKLDPMRYAGQLAYYRELVKEKHGVVCDCYLAVVDKSTYTKHVAFYKFRPETLDAEMELTRNWVEQIIEAEDLGLFSRVPEELRVCWTCDNYSACPFSVQKDFFEV